MNNFVPGINDGRYQTALADPGQLYISNDFGVNWNRVIIDDGADKTWEDVSISNDGQYQTAAVRNGFLYTSSDFGQTWTPRDSQRSWWDTHISNDGSYQTAVARNVTPGSSTETIYTSDNFGVTWTPREEVRLWQAVAMNGDGRYQTAVVTNGGLYTSNDFGITWNLNNNIPDGSTKDWRRIAINTDGRYQTAVVNNGQIFTSSDFGTTWVARDSSRNWWGIAINNDGRYQTATVSNGQVYRSTDFGVNWTVTTNGLPASAQWRDISINGEGRYQSTIARNNNIYTSNDFGVTWVARDQVRTWMDIYVNKLLYQWTDPIRFGICETNQPKNKKKYFDFSVDCSCNTNSLPSHITSVNLAIGDNPETACLLGGNSIIGYYLSDKNLNNLNTKVYKNIHLNLYLNDGYYSFGSDPNSPCRGITRSWFRIINGKIVETVQCGCGF